MRGFVRRTGLGDSVAAGDIGLVTQRDVCVGSVVPSKVYGLLAAGRPVLFIGPAMATPARIIRRFGCGWHVACGDSASLIALLRLLAARPCSNTSIDPSASTGSPPSWVPTAPAMAHRFPIAHPTTIGLSPLPRSTK